MRLPPSRPVSLTTGGVNLKCWPDTRARLRHLAAIRDKPMAVVLDELVTEALEMELTRLVEGGTP